MNHDSDTEMDILLRRHARRSAQGFASTKGMDARDTPGDVRESSTHMDADELSAYAEGSLPERARSRYLAHLADCDACRRIVTELLISSEPEAKEGGPVAQTVGETNRSWREWFGALFSPPVLRFAVPALTLFAVIAVVLIVATRNRNETSFVARNDEPQRQIANTSTEEQKPTTATSNAATVGPENQGANSNTNANTQGATSPASSEQKNSSATTGAAAPPPPPDGAAATPKTANLPVVEPQPSAAQDREAANRKTAPEQSNSRTEAYGNLQKEKDDVALADQRRRDVDKVASGGAPSAAARQQEESASNSALGAGTTSTARKRNESAKSAAPAPATRAARGASGADEGETETRSVAGKRFRKQNGVWVDTTYNSSRSLVTVRRGTEQYRALVADEPIIGTASGELGNVIIVVGGRAYHIY